MINLPLNSRSKLGSLYFGGGPSPYYMGFWPAAGQTTADTTLRDASGNGAHSKTLWDSAEAFDTVGYLHSNAVQNECALLDRSHWAHSFFTDSFVVAGSTVAVATGSSVRFFGDGVTNDRTGFAFMLSATGAFQVNATGPAGMNLFTPTSGANHWASESEHFWVFAWDHDDASSSVWVDGVLRIDRSTNITRAQWELTETARTHDMGIGGRGGNPTVALLENKTRFVHALNFPNRGLPSNIATLAAALYAKPIEMLSRDLVAAGL